MRSTEYDWSSIDTPPEIRSHSINKHEVLTGYLKRYITKLAGPARSGLRIHFVDGFAGGGIYRKDDGQLHFGSSVQAVQAIRDQEALLPEMLGKKVPCNAHYYFVEKKKQSLQTLKAVFDQQGIVQREGERFQFIHGAFERVAHTIVEQIQSRGRTHRVIFNLDQYGYSQVPLSTLRWLFSELPDAEVILTFSADWIIDYLSGKPGMIAQCQRRLDNIGLECYVTEMLHVKSERVRSEYRLLIQDQLSEQLRQNSGAKYYTRYFIQTEGKGGHASHRHLWLVHLSQHPVARDEMVQTHWDKSNQRFTHAGFAGIDDTGWRGLGYTPSADASRPQVMLDYDFDDRSAQLSHDVLLGQLSELLWDRKVITFGDLYGLTCNHMPVDMNHIREVLDVLMDSKQISVVSLKGEQRQVGRRINATDLITFVQRSLFV